MLFIKNPQYLRNHYETWLKWATTLEYLILTKFRNYCVKVDFLINSIFLGQSQFGSACMCVKKLITIMQSYHHSHLIPWYTIILISRKNPNRTLQVYPLNLLAFKTIQITDLGSLNETPIVLWESHLGCPGLYNFVFSFFRI